MSSRYLIVEENAQIVCDRRIAYRLKQLGVSWQRLEECSENPIDIGVLNKTDEDFLNEVRKSYTYKEN